MSKQVEFKNDVDRSVQRIKVTAIIADGKEFPIDPVICEGSVSLKCEMLDVVKFEPHDAVEVSEAHAHIAIDNATNGEYTGGKCMTPEQFNIIKKLLRGDFKEYPTPATHGEYRSVDFEGWRYDVEMLDNSPRNPMVAIDPAETCCIALDDGDGNWIWVTPEQCAEWDEYQREEMKWADNDR